MKELEFQKWLKQVYIPAAFSLYEKDLIDIVVPSDRRTSGISDMLILTSSGVVALEVKFRHHPKDPKPHHKAFKHEISILQKVFLVNWWDAHSGLSYVLYGNSFFDGSSSMYLIPANKLKSWNLGNVTWEDMEIASDFIVNLVIGNSKDEILQNGSADAKNFAFHLVEREYE